MKKKIVIVTWIGVDNYGTILQAFALFRKIQSLGHHVELLDSYLPYDSLKMCFMRFLNRLHIYKPLLKIKYLTKPKHLRRIAKFKTTNESTVDVFGKRALQTLVRRTDVFISGSDQIWNVYYNFDKSKFLNFAQDKKRIAYASSMGTESFPLESIIEITSYLSKFSHIGVREQTASAFLKNLLPESDIKQVLDPTLLLSKNEWLEIASKGDKVILPQKYILCYFIGNKDSYRDSVKRIKSISGIENIVVVPSAENKSFNIEGCITMEDCDPYDFINIINNSSLVCTDSFHATAFSVNFEKDFLEFMRFDDNLKTSQNSRIYDFLRKYGLEERIYRDCHESVTKINYKSVTDKLILDRKESLQFLINSIDH